MGAPWAGSSWVHRGHLICTYRACNAMRPLPSQRPRDCVCTDAVYSYEGSCARHPLGRSVHPGIYLRSGLDDRELVRQNDPHTNPVVCRPDSFIWGGGGGAWRQVLQITSLILTAYYPRSVPDKTVTIVPVLDLHEASCTNTLCPAPSTSQGCGHAPAQVTAALSLWGRESLNQISVRGVCSLHFLCGGGEGEAMCRILQLQQSPD